MPLRMAKSLTELTQDEAGVLIDFIDRGYSIDGFAGDRLPLDDLLLVASGLSKVLLPPYVKPEHATTDVACTVCGVRFEAKRSDAMYCGKRCRQRAADGRNRQIIAKGYPEYGWARNSP